MNYWIKGILRPPVYTVYSRRPVLHRPTDTLTVDRWMKLCLNYELVMLMINCLGFRK